MNNFISGIIDEHHAEFDFDSNAGDPTSHQRAVRVDEQATSRQPSHLASHVEPSEPLTEPHRTMNKPSKLRSSTRPRPGFVDHTTDHVNRVLSGSAELRPHRSPDHVAMMIAAKNGATTTATTVMTTGRKARGPDNFITADQISIQR